MSWMCIFFDAKNIQLILKLMRNLLSLEYTFLNVSGNDNTETGLCEHLLDQIFIAQSLLHRVSYYELQYFPNVHLSRLLFQEEKIPAANRSFVHPLYQAYLL